MSYCLLTMVEREIFGWPGVSKETGKGGPVQDEFWVLPFTPVYRFGRRARGHVQHNGVAASRFEGDPRRANLC